MKQILTLLAAAMLLAACSKTDYIDTIPANATALLSVDAANAGSAKGRSLLNTLLFATNADRTGIDLSQRLYFFETADGNLGLCASVNSADNLTATFARLHKKGRSKAVSERDGLHFTVIADVWTVAFNDVALLVVGPVPVADQPQMQSRLARSLQQSEERSVRHTPMFAKLDSLDAPLTLVAQTAALPEKLATPLSLGAPRDADASQVLVAAEMTMQDGQLRVVGETFSFNKSIDRALKAAAASYRPISGRFLGSVPSDVQTALFLNADGRQLLPLMQGNAGLQTLLAGVNTAIDMDNIVKSFDGDIAVFSQHGSTSFTAELRQADWLADVAYWKQSCPPGSHIADWGRTAYAFSDGTTSFFFGVSADTLFYSGTSRDAALRCQQQADQPLPQKLQQSIAGQRLVVLLNLADLLPQQDSSATADDGSLSALTPLLRSLLGSVSTIVYTMK